MWANYQRDGRPAE